MREDDETRDGDETETETRDGEEREEKRRALREERLKKKTPSMMVAEEQKTREEQ
jgi:hypothetical protein